MTYLELAKKVLEETQQLMWVDDIWKLAKEKGYSGDLEKTYDSEQDNINALDSALYRSVGTDSLGLLKSEGLYYLTTFDNLSQLVADALDGSSIKSYQEVLDNQSVKTFSPTKRGFDGMLLFFVVPIGLPLSFYITGTGILGTYMPSMELFAGTFSLTCCFALLVFLYIQLTNCNVNIHPDKIEFARIFRPHSLIGTIPIKDIVEINVKGLGREEQISSDFKYIKIKFKKNNKEATQLFRCHAYINPNPNYDPSRIQLKHHENFANLRAFLKEICVHQGANYSEL